MFDMTQQEAYNTLRDILNRELPELLELKFGCEVVLRKEEHSSNYKVMTVTNFRHVKGVPTIYEYYELFENGTGNLVYTERGANEFKILGTPPTLQEILRVIKRDKYVEYPTPAEVDPEDKNFCIVHNDIDSDVEYTVVDYDITKPVEEQSVGALEKIIKLLE